MEVLLFGGTLEGRVLAEGLAARGIRVTCSVATEYGQSLIHPAEGLTVRTGRLNQGEMESLMKSGNYACVVDATHPYAAEVSRNLKGAAEHCALSYYRLLRASETAENVRWAASVEEAARYLDGRKGPVLLTTGSKELAGFTGIQKMEERLWVRILPAWSPSKLPWLWAFPPSTSSVCRGPSQKS